MIIRQLEGIIALQVILKSFKDLLRKESAVTQPSGVYLPQSETVIAMNARESGKILFLLIIMKAPLTGLLSLTQNSCKVSIQNNNKICLKVVFMAAHLFL